MIITEEEFARIVAVLLMANDSVKGYKTSKELSEYLKDYKDSIYDTVTLGETSPEKVGSETFTQEFLRIYKEVTGE